MLIRILEDIEGDIMLRILGSLYKNEKGQALVFIAFSIAILLGFAAVAVDYGYLAWQRRELQNAADAAALAAAWELPDNTKVTGKAREYAKQNATELSNSEIVAVIQNNDKEVKVDVEHDYETFFAKILGSSSERIGATATAERIPWAGDSLPFINLDDDYADDEQIQLWEKVTPGDFESIWKDDYKIMNPADPERLYFEVYYQDGLEITKGTVATIKQEIETIYNQGREPVYLLSLSSEVMNSGQVLLTDGTKRPLNKLKNKDNIEPSQLVLIACTFDSYDFNNKDGKLQLTVLEVFDIFEGELPNNYTSMDGRVRLKN